MEKLVVVQHPELPWIAVAQRESDGFYTLVQMHIDAGTEVDSCRAWFAREAADQGYEAEFLDPASPEGIALAIAAFGKEPRVDDYLN